MTGRVRTPLWLQMTAVFTVGTLVGAFSAVQVAPRITTVGVADGASFVDPGQPGGPLPTSIPTSGGNPTTNPGGEVVQPGDNPSDVGVPPTPEGFTCSRDGNGGNPGNAKGVSGDTIKLATTTVQSGNGASFLGEVRFGIEAVVNKVNRAGGICGRRLEVRYVDDAWDASRGHNYIRNFINEDIFAIIVGASSEGLNAAIGAGDIDKASIPVVGADGMVKSQYESPWVWPVAVSTVSTARIMARNAYYKRGARKFSIVFDRDYKFGQEAALAYYNEIKRLPGASMAGFNPQYSCKQSFCGIKQGQSSYATEIQQFEPGEFVAMFLEPGTAQTWMAGAGSPKPTNVKYGIGAAQPMFTRDFANNCRQACHKMWIWRAYRPPMEPYQNERAVQTYANDLEQTKPGADQFNAFTEGGYVGATLLVEALKATGPYLTREALQANLNALQFKPQLTMQSVLDWSPAFKYANTTMRAFEIQYVSTFNGWKAQDIERDETPELGSN